jgi:transcriptional regulator with XRE-family HTH domain
MTFAVKLRELRDAKGWSQKELADRSGTNQQNIARWETGERMPGFDSVQSLCTALGVRCTVFDGCTHEPVDDKRGRGRPPKDDGVKAAKVKRKKGGA